MDRGRKKVGHHGLEMAPRLRRRLVLVIIIPSTLWVVLFAVFVKPAFDALIDVDTSEVVVTRITWVEVMLCVAPLFVWSGICSARARRRMEAEQASGASHYAERVATCTTNGG